MNENYEKWQFGCGPRKFEGWLNTDRELDLKALPLPFKDESFSIIFSQHVLEHFDIKSQVLPLLKECRRIIKAKGSIYVAVPDLGKLCRAYVNGALDDLIDGKLRRFPGRYDRNFPKSQIINDIAFAKGSHKNLFDFELMSWCLEKTGWTDIREINEQIIKGEFPEYEFRRDEEQTLYVVATPALN